MSIKMKVGFSEKIIFEFKNYKNMPLNSLKYVKKFKFNLEFCWFFDYSYTSNQFQLGKIFHTSM